jgi:3alpha(or 20beta)-hydroxysteroid dehydrogenase
VALASGFAAIGREKLSMTALVEQNSPRLAGKVAVITGAARGIGAETARLFVRHGARVVLVDVLAERAQQLAQELGAAAAFCAADVTSPADWQRVVGYTNQTFGPVTVLVNNAATLTIAKLEDTDVALLERVFRVNQLGPILGIKAVTADMVAAGGGSIVNIGSVDGLAAQDIGLSAYGATKWALRGITKMAALELGRFGIRVNCVHPDGGNPEMSAPFMPPNVNAEQAMSDHVHQILVPPRGMPRNQRMRDVAYMNLFLASDESTGCTGADYPVDGGYSAGHRVT